MKRIFSSMMLGAVIVAGSIGAAAAADLYGGRGSLKDTYMPVDMPSSAAWYIRGQFGYSYQDRPGMTEVAPGVTSFELNDTSIDPTWTAGIGVGRYFTRNIRGDITWDHRWEADMQGTGPAFGGTPFALGTRYFGLKSDVLLANVYYDFDMGRFRPYIGFGIGTTYNQTTKGHVADACGCTADIAGASQWSIAGALMTGFSLQLRDRLHMDAGYRYLYLGEAHTGAITGTGLNVGTNSGDPKVTDITAHEFRVGLRYDIR